MDAELSIVYTNIMNEESKDKLSVIVILVVMVMFVGGYFIYNYWSDSRKCDDMALTASVEEVTPSMYPNASDRGYEQKQYQRRYKQTCMDLQ
jgi:flagellar basal body-associated protein FliL